MQIPINLKPYSIMMSIWAALSCFALIPPTNVLVPHRVLSFQKKGKDYPVWQKL
jgi:hypothetical protein